VAEAEGGWEAYDICGVVGANWLARFEHLALHHKQKHFTP
jgi:hypothetical protein